MSKNFRKVLDSYWPSIALVAVLLLAVVLLPGNDDDTGRITTGGPATSGPGATSPGGGPTSTSIGRPQGRPGASPSTLPGGTSQGPVTSATSAASPAGAVPGAGQATAGGAAAGPAPPAPGEPGAGGAPVTAPPPQEGGRRPKVDPPPGFGTGCRVDGRQPIISAGHPPFSPPCAPLFTGENSGASAPGVTGDTIVLARYHATPNAATTAALTAAGVTDEPADVERIENYLARYFNTHFETYGREVVLVHLTGSGTDQSAQVSDAIKIAEEINAFACLGCPRYAAEELAARGRQSIITFESNRYVLDRVKGYLFGSLPILEEYYESMGEFWAKRLHGRKARFAGEPLLQAADRKFGLIWRDGEFGEVDVGAVQARDYYVNEVLASSGITLGADAAYNFDLTVAGEQAVNIIAKMKSNGVTTVTLVGDPLYPIFLTREATRQAYFPEWFISGTALTDITFFGRTYDGAQWKNAFGQSPLWVFYENYHASNGPREYFHACLGGPNEADCEPGKEGVGTGVYRADLAIFFTGLHMAGPHLTAQTLAQGFYSYPPSGGYPNATLNYWTPDRPTVIKDRTEVFWDPQRRGKDEVDKDGVGVIVKANGGARYTTGEWPTTEPENDPSKAAFVSDEPIGYDPGPPHESDDHKHPAEQRCLSCRH